MRFYQHIVFIFILLVLQGKTFSHARPVKKVTVTVVTTQRELAMDGDNNFSLQKENLRNGAKVSVETENSKKVSMASSVEGAVGKRKGDERKKWKDNLMAFSADYRSPKSHPPKNN